MQCIFDLYILCEPSLYDMMWSINRGVKERSFLTFWPEIRDATASSMKKMECYVRLVEVAAMQL